MKQSTLITLIIGSLLAMMALLAASCSSSSDEAVTGGGGLQPTEGNNLVVYIGTASNLSRAAATTDPGQAAENQINRVTLLIFGQNGIAKSIQEVVPTGQLINTRVPNLVVGDRVYLAVNISSNVFSSISRLADFEETTIAIDRAILGGSSNDQVANPANAPMFGKATLQYVTGRTDAFQATVPVNHMLAKVTLNTLNAMLLGDATFTPTEIFLRNVPEYLYLSTANSAAEQDYRFFDNEGRNFYQGEVSNNEFFRAYLGTGANLGGFMPTSPTLTATASSWNDNEPALVFYTMPNNAGTPTQLVIKGQYKPANTDESKTVYYSMYLNYNTNSSVVPNGGPTRFQLYPNYNYSVNVMIKNAGTDNVDDNPNPDMFQYFTKVEEDYTFGVLQSVNAQFHENDRQNQSETSGDRSIAGIDTVNTVVSGSSYENYDFLDNLSVGNFLFADGSYGSVPNNPGKTPIGIIFSITPSTNDGAYHGYAMALRDVNSSATCTWGPAGNIEDLADLTGTSSYTDRSSDMEGRTNTTEYLSSTAYAAAQAARNYSVAAPAGTSGWFLPSTGQWFQILTTLGSMSTADALYYGWDGSTTNMVSNQCAQSINNRLSALPSSTYDAFEMATTTGYSYWTSSEYNGTDAHTVVFGSDGKMSFAANASKSTTHRARAIIAF